MKTYLIPAVLAALFASCEQKETTINPPAQHTEKTTIITPAPAEKTTEKKTETETKVSPGGTVEKKETTTEEKK
ncbi:hypothetical protein OKA05_10940 [Luteolibacter arcticus]|uniref:Uncharacterized protein n=1 Tax=Luteolibacter arcticus TaxID=1581411 RepID=A0ABT3GHT7_9BACT|nr:hypothetical protein [Luteolibacter arcticus]MCW1923069.1 hypothetical protein [Luteolibacter arcticus]